ncbi:MAG: tryptophan-rich sensory protein [Actinobacteria bacterium]|jgi:tryptophan-rich sensory protein|nr:tryptophan-rich sensory protein [Actinomycetota bacterium]
MRNAIAAAGLLGLYLVGQGASVALTGRRTDQDGTEQSRREFERLPTPEWAPPAPTYGIVWSGLALTSSAAAARVVAKGSTPEGLTPQAQRAMAWWVAATLPRSAYTPLAFGSRRLWAATADAGLLAATWGGFALAAAKVDRTAAALALPELAWTSFATVLSAATARNEQRA